jgi:hypothetical protein
MLESKGAFVAANGLSLSDWMLARLDLPSAQGSRIAPLAN